MSYLRSQNNLELNMQKTMADIEVKKFAEMVSAIGRDTLAAISRAGPETQVTQLLMCLGTRKAFFGGGGGGGGGFAYWKASYLNLPKKKFHYSSYS